MKLSDIKIPGVDPGKLRKMMSDLDTLMQKKFYTQQDVDRLLREQEARILAKIPQPGISKFGFDEEWRSWSGQSTITGWSSYTEKEIWYCRLGTVVFVEATVSGTSNATGTSFTVPYSKQRITGTTIRFPAHIVDNGTGAIGYGLIATNSATVTFFKDGAGSAFTASGTKRVNALFWYSVA